MQELSLNILDIAQNSVKANATLIEITVEEQAEQDLLVITVKDNGCGMSPELVKKATDPFFTTRTTRKVGLGLPFFKMAAESAGGNFEIDSRPGEGTVVKATFALGHIDRMPLGNVSETFASLVQCSPNIDFVLTCICDGRKFALDTRKLRETLEDVPIDNPQIIRFIKDYVKENLADLLKD